MPVSGTTVVRRQLGRRLRRLRETAGKTDRDVEEASLASRTKLWRIETGKTPVKVADVRALCWLYGADDAQTSTLASLAAGTAEHGWWEDYGDVVPVWRQLFVSLEGAADTISSYRGELVPGLLQTADYARAVSEAARPDHDETKIRRQVELRLERQNTVFGRTPAPRLDVVLSEGVLVCQVGGPATMRAQLERLREFNRLDQVQVRVLPFEAGAHAAMVGGFHLFEFIDVEDPDVVFLETQVGGHYLEKPAELTEYRRALDLISKQAVPMEEQA